jgi:YVTN family beta-propeller protein
LTSVFSIQPLWGVCPTSVLKTSGANLAFVRHMGNAGLTTVFQRSPFSCFHIATFAIVILSTNASALTTNFVNFETAPVHPLDLGPDGRTLALCNLPDNRVELFDVSTGVPMATGTVPVGLAGNPRRAWVSCSRTNAVLVIDPQTRSTVTHLAIEGERPRAMATSPDGSKVYVAIFESGNGTTVLGRPLVDLNTASPPGPVEDPNGPYRGTNPPPNSGMSYNPPINPKLGRPPPRVSHIVRKNAAGRWMDDNNGDWTQWVSGTNAPSSGRIVGWDLPDRDVAIIDTATLQVSYAHRLMNICMAIAVNPVSGQIAVVGTDATNERRFEPVLNGVFLRVNLALVDPITRTNRIRDLDSHLNYITRTLPPAQRALSIADPRGIQWNSAGTRAYITGMGSRNLVIVDANGNRVNPQPVELGEGPTGMALDESRARLYIWNRFSSSISVLNTSTATVITNVPVFDPTPEIIRKGRPHLYDARKTSGLGITACASCHVDGRTDRLAWDLGDPAGNLATNTNAGRIFHPMKGPMVTQTFQDIITPFFGGFARIEQSLHWRGDRNNLEEFNVTFTNLQANDVVLTTNEFAEFKGMLATIFFPPNPLRTFSNSLPASLALPGHLGPPPTNGGPRSPLPPGRPIVGEFLFSSDALFSPGQTKLGCASCHAGNRGGRFGGPPNSEITFMSRNEQLFKMAQLRSLPDKLGMDGFSTNSRAGFGFMHDGRVDTLTRVLVEGFRLQDPQPIADMIAFLLCFTGSDLPRGLTGRTEPIVGLSQDVPATTGKQVTFAAPTPPPLLDAMFNLALQTNSRVELVIRGPKNNRPRSWLLRRQTGDFQSDRHHEIAHTLAQVIAAAAPGDEFTAMMVPEGSGVRIALDRDGDSYFDTTEIESGANPADPASYPIRILSVSRSATTATLTWESVPGTSYLVQWRANLAAGSWNNLGEPLIANSATATRTDSPPPTALRRFYRVRTQP